MSDVQGLIETALTSVLSANASILAAVGTNIFQEQAKAKTALPYIVFVMVDGGDDNSNPTRTMTFDYQFDAIAADRATARLIAGYIDDALHHKPLTLAGWTNYWITGGRLKSFTENVDGSQVYHRIRTFNIKISQ
jgi:hypothetical protein